MKSINLFPERAVVSPARGRTIASRASDTQSKSSNKKAPIQFLVLFALLVLGWVTEQFALVNVGKYSIILLYLAALPFCLRVTSRSVCFVILPLLSTLGGALVGWFTDVPRSGIVSQSGLQLLAIFFAAGIASFDWRAHLKQLAQVMVVVGVPVVFYGGYQMLARIAHMAYAFLPVTNQQEYAEGGLQRGWEKEHFTRASSFFVEPAAFGYFCVWLMILGLSLQKSRLRYWALALAFSGILFSQSLSAVLAVAILLLAYLFTNRINFTVIRQVLGILLLSGIAISVVPLLAPEAFSRFSDRIEQAVSFDERADSGRVDHLPACWAIFKDAPVWGHGISSLSTADLNGSDITSVTYALLLMERGLVGTILFLVPWVAISARACFLPPSDPFRTIAILLSTLQLYAFATSSLAYFLPFWLSLGITASLVLRTHRSAKELRLTGFANRGIGREVATAGSSRGLLARQ